jgi:CBS-domain-containing membrane protein
MQVEELMSKQVQCCDPNDSLERAAQLMWDHDCGCLPVCNHSDGGHRAIGAITDRDICMCALFQRKPLADLKVDDAMAKQLLACQPNDTVDRAESMMRSGKIRRLPVLDAQGQVRGFISLADLARGAARQSANIHQGISESEVGETLAAICTPPAHSLEARA